MIKERMHVSFAPLPTIEKGFACVVIDAPLHFGTWSARGQDRAPSRHYRTYPAKIIATLPVREIIARNSWIFMWWPDVHLPSLLATMSAFGFSFSGKAFTWVKTRSALARGPQLLSSADMESVLHLGGGLTTRKNSESCWLGRHGKPQRLSKSVREVILAPLREHSRKPDEFFKRVEAFCEGPRIDLFARESREAWVTWGDQTTRFDAPAPALPAPLCSEAA